jgi:hypothetical protein
MKRLAQLAGFVAIVIWLSLSAHAVTANACGATAGTVPRNCTAALSVNAGDTLAAFSAGNSGTGCVLATPSDGVNTYTLIGSAVSGNSNLGKFWVASASTTATLTLTFSITSCSSTGKVEGVIVDLGATGGQDSSLAALNTFATSTSWSYSSNLSTTFTDQILVCGAQNSSTSTDAISASTSAGAFAIPTNGSASVTGASAACEYLAATGSFSYTSGTALLTVGTSEAHVLGMWGFLPSGGAVAQKNFLMLGVGP